MSLDTKTHQAEQAIKDRDFEQALKFANEAVAIDPTLIKAYNLQSVILQRLKRYQEAFKSSEIAIANAQVRGRREPLGEAQFRRALALYYLKRYADAEQSLHLAEQYGHKDKSMSIWKDKIEDKLQAAEEPETVAIEDIPDCAVTVKPATQAQQNGGDDDNDDEKDMKDALKLKEEYKKAASAPKPVVYDHNVKKDWYQNATTVNVSVFLKNAPKEHSVVKFEPQMAVIETRQPSDGAPFTYKLDLCHGIKPEESKFKVFGTKIELTLAKADDTNWKQLAHENSEQTGGGPSLDEMRAALNEPKLPAVNGNKNWDELAETALEDWKQTEGDDKEGEDFFKQLYSNADPDTQRAMMKSYVESNGTALSTDWGEVQNKKYEVDPPDSMVAKPYPI